MKTITLNRFLFATTGLFLLAGPVGASERPMIELNIKGESKTFDSLEEAITASRQYDDTSGKTIRIGSGNLFLAQTIELDKRDKGLTIKAARQHQAKLIGGRLITAWKQGKDGLWSAPLPETKAGDWSFRTLLVNGKTADRARYPENGRLENENKWSVRWLSTAEGGWERQPTVEERTHMIYKEGDLSADFDVGNAEFTIFHRWDETLVAAREFLPEKNTVIFSNPTTHPLGCFGKHDYVVWNIRKGLTRPGQWYLDRENGELFYWPEAGVDMATAEIIAPTLEAVIHLENTSHITLEGLAIMAANTPLMVGDFGAKLFNGAVSATNTDHSHFEQLNIHGVTGWGLKLFGDHLTVKDCHVHHTGAGAIRLIGSHGLIENNDIHDVGLTYPSAIALYVGVTDPNMEDEWELGKDESHVTIRHNEIHDGPYCGIGLGGQNHLVEYNKLSRVMQQLTDGSAIYATFCGNLRMRYNVVRDIEKGPVGMNHAYYLDELSDDVVVEYNIAMNVPAALHSHMSKGNVFQNNIIISPDPIKTTFPRCGPNTMERNVFVSDGSITFTHPSTLELKNNLLQTPRVQEQTYREQYKKNDPVELKMTHGNLNTEAGLIINGDDITFTQDSPAHQLGIKPIMGSEAGLINAAPRDF